MFTQSLFFVVPFCLLIICVWSSPVSAVAPVNSSELLDELILLQQYSAIAQVGEVVLRNNWNCGSRCQGPLVSTTILDTILPNNSADTRGYIAIQHELKTIFVVFRGSVSAKNWLLDFFLLGEKLDLSSEETVNVLVNSTTGSMRRRDIIGSERVDDEETRRLKAQASKNLASAWGSSPSQQASLLSMDDRVPLDARVHKGFFISYKTVRSVVQTRLKELYETYPGYKFTFVGHSLGGALATLAGLDFYLARIPPRSDPSIPEESFPTILIQTYGQPRIGNRAFANWMCSLTSTQQFKIQRVTAEGDIVPQLPPTQLGYFHHGQEFFIQRNSSKDAVSSNGTTIMCDKNPKKPCGESTGCMRIWQVRLAQLGVHANGYYNVSEDWIP